MSYEQERAEIQLITALNIPTRLNAKLGDIIYPRDNKTEKPLFYFGSWNRKPTWQVVNDIHTIPDAPPICDTETWQTEETAKLRSMIIKLEARIMELSKLSGVYEEMTD